MPASRVLSASDNESRSENLAGVANDGFDVRVAKHCAKGGHVASPAVPTVADNLVLFLIGESVLDQLNIGAETAATSSAMALRAPGLVDVLTLEQFFVCVVGQSHRLGTARSE